MVDIQIVNEAKTRIPRGGDPIFSTQTFRAAEIGILSTQTFGGGDLEESDRRYGAVRNDTYFKFRPTCGRFRYWVSHGNSPLRGLNGQEIL